MTRTPPNDEAAERAVIGSALLAPNLVAALAEVVQPEDFYRPAHTELWRVLVGLHDSGAPADAIAVAAHLADTGSLLRLGGAAYLHTLIAAVPSPANASHYARIVADHARRREVADLGSRLSHLARSTGDTRDVLAAGREFLFRRAFADLADTDAVERTDPPAALPRGRLAYLAG